MLLRMSNLFVRTLREDPAEAEVPSHRLLVRAGYVRRVAPGGYAWLPLGKLVLDRVAAVVREEMAAIGAQEVSLPSLLPQERYETSGRLAAFGDDVFRLRDRRGAGYVLGPTHEELFTLLVKDLYGSYRDYPVTLYQVGTKFRDEARPRGGLLRGREFLMKDAYSFDLDDEGLRRSYDAQREAYIRVFDRLGLDYTIVAAATGAMGGSGSEEFLAPAPVGEDTYVACTACDYAANTEAVTTPAPAADQATRPASTVFDTPGTPTIESLVAYANSVGAGGRTDWTAADTLKNVVLRAGDSLLVIGVPGDREVDLKRVEAALYPVTVELFDDFAAHPDLIRGYIGPQVLAKLGIRYLVDPRVVPGTAWLTGANEPDRHAVNVVCGRDFTPDGTIEAADVRAGDPCPACGQPLALRRGIEIGHIFQLGRRFADAFGLDALGPDGQPVRVTMGSYGIGVSRVVAAIAEQHHDERGLSWPASVAPCRVHVVAAGKGEQAEAAQRLASELASRGIDVLLDDRPGLSAGVRFADAELLGMPLVVVVGRRLAEGYVEVRSRIDNSRTDVPVDEVVELVSTRCGG
ncbi:proline--tRNA ligase [Planosporangium flavigriseum]|uniref:Proline--tRNA ligase n=1 Tax=Planosporangium flavigriseum TaxID=373681 RepID=A0A8J3LK81_9ACTN|nr:proline--tRNA ligase [Planosporangium flavigriseum]NJC64443.1 proline--tRNA ligase [Planosporangium flavigriseum]GIG72080.1 proline--tRNA ligase [Planosporangium flavigriseum]